VYGTRYYGVLEANYAICATHLVNFFVGSAAWRYVVALPAWLVPYLGASLTVSDICLVLVSVAGLSQGAHNLCRVLLAPGLSTALSDKERGHKHTGHLAALAHLILLTSVLALGAWYLTLAQGSQWMQCRAAFTTFGILYALTASQLIMAHMCKEPLELPLVPLGVLLLGVANQAVAPDGIIEPLLLALLLMVLVAGWYFSYVASVIQQICASLGIKAFTIKSSHVA